MSKSRNQVVKVRRSLYPNRIALMEIVNYLWQMGYQVKVV